MARENCNARPPPALPLMSSAYLSREEHLVTEIRGAHLDRFKCTSAFTDMAASLGERQRRFFPDWRGAAEGAAALLHNPLACAGAIEHFHRLSHVLQPLQCRSTR